MCVESKVKDYMSVSFDQNCLLWFGLFMFRHITLKQLNSLTIIDKFSCLIGLEVEHQTAVQGVMRFMYK